MKKFWSTLAVQLGKRAGIVSIVGLLVTMIMAFGLTKLEFATGQDSYLNKDDQIAIDNVAYQDLFGGQIMLVLITMDEGRSVAELGTGENRQTFLDVTEELEANPNIESIVTPLTALEFTNNLITRTPDQPTEAPAEFSATSSIAGTILLDATAREPSPEGKEARTADSLATLERVTPFQEDQASVDLENPEWIDFLLHDNQGEIRKSLQTFFPDERHAQMIVRLKGNASIEVEGEGAVAVKEAWADKQIDGAEITVTGAPVLLKDINDYLRGGILTLGGIALAIMCLILLVLFDVRWRLLPLAVILVGITWAFGLAGYLGIPLSIVTIAGLPVMLGVGIDYAIQMHARVEEEVIVDRADHPIQETSRNLGPALLVVTFDAIFAFSALFFAKVPMIRAFGLLLAVGIAVICLCSIVLPIAALGAREYRSPTKGRDFREGALGKLVVRLGSLPPAVAPVLIAISALIFAGGILVEDKLELQTDPVQWVDQESQNRKDVATLEREVGASSELGTYVVADSRDELFSDENVEFIHTFTAETLAAHPGQLLRASSILTPISYLTEIEGASDIVPTGEQMRAVYDAAPEPIQRFTVSSDDPAMNVLFTTRPGPLGDKAEMVSEIRDDVSPPPGIRATPSGLAVVGVGLLENLESNRVLLTYLAIGFVGLFLAIRLKSLIRSTLSLVPVLIATGAASLVAYAFDLKLSPMTAVGGPLVIAICTEFTSLILLRFVEERQRGLSPQAAADVAAARTGRAFIVSGLTGVVGVAVIATSPLPVLRDFGIIVAMNVVVALLSALVFLPPMMVWAEKRRWVTKGLVDPALIGDKTHDESTPTPDLSTT